MFLFYVLSFFKKGDTIQWGTLFKGGHYLRKYVNCIFFTLDIFISFVYKLQLGKIFGYIFSYDDIISHCLYLALNTQETSHFY